MLPWVQEEVASGVYTVTPRGMGASSRAPRQQQQMHHKLKVPWQLCARVPGRRAERRGRPIEAQSAACLQAYQRAKSQIKEGRIETNSRPAASDVQVLKASAAWRALQTYRMWGPQTRRRPGCSMQQIQGCSHIRPGMYGGGHPRTTYLLHPNKSHSLSGLKRRVDLFLTGTISPCGRRSKTRATGVPGSCV